MKRLQFFSFTLTLFVHLMGCVVEKTEEVDTEKLKGKLTESIQRFNEAFQKGNIEVLESLITKNYIHTNGNSKSIGKREWLNYLEKRNQDIESGNLEITSYEMDELELEYYDKAAIVTGRIQVSSIHNNQAQHKEYRVTNIWVYEAGTWKRAGFHDGVIK